MALDRNIRVAFQISNQDEDTSEPLDGKKLEDAYALLMRARVQNNVFGAGGELTSPDVLVLGAEASVKNKRFDLAANALHSFFLQNPPKDQVLHASDLVAQSYSKTYGLKVGIIRCGNIYGPADYNLDRLIPGIIINTLKNKRIVIRSSGKLIRDYIYVSDAAMAYIMLMKKMLKDSKKLFIYNIGSKHNLTALIMLDKIQKLMKKKITPLIKNNSKIEIKKQKLNYQKACKELKWKPKYNIKDLVKEMVNSELKKLI